MQIVHITDGDREWFAIKVPSLSRDPADLAQIVAILMGQHEQSGRLINDVIPGSPVAELGARQFAIIAFDEAPSGGFGVGGAYGVTDWVAEHLNPAMPDGFGAAHSDAVMWPLVGDAKSAEYRVECDRTARYTTEIAGLPIAYCALISPMDRAATSAVGAYLRDFDAPDGSSGLLPITI